MSNPIVSIRNITKRFGQVTALNDVSVDIKLGEIFALLGPSGCGKSTLLRILSGFETPTEGELLLDGNDMLPLKPNKRPINMVFQSYAVFPHMSVADNVAYGLKMEKVPHAEISERVKLALEQVHLSEYGERMPEQLSGGQRQRVALARVLVKKPRLLLLDEPLSALDAKLRDAMRLELVKLQESVGITFVIVTHDQAEAMAIADRIAVLESGCIRQVASPAQLYQQPVDAFVADFIGTIHTFKIVRLTHNIETVDVETPRLGNISLPLPTVAENLQSLLASNTNSSDTLMDNLVVAVRPEKINVLLDEPSHQTVSIKGRLGDIAFQGQHSIVEVILDQDRSITAIVTDEQAKALASASEQTPIWACWAVDAMLLLPKDARELP